MYSIEIAVSTVHVWHLKCNNYTLLPIQAMVTYNKKTLIWNTVTLT
jgi:hypothetical protein